jgi:hypothetical protein
VSPAQLKSNILPFQERSLNLGLRTVGLSVSRFPLIGISVLVVDEPLVALDVGAALRDAGANVITATNRPARKVRRGDIQAAILDINLFAHDCAAVCRTLSSRGAVRVPRAFRRAGLTAVAGGSGAYLPPAVSRS